MGFTQGEKNVLFQRLLKQVGYLDEKNDCKVFRPIL